MSSQQIDLQNRIFESSNANLKEAKDFCKNCTEKSFNCLNCRLKYIILTLEDLMRL